MNFLRSKGEWGRDWIHHVFLCRKEGLENCQGWCKETECGCERRMTMNIQYNLHCYYKRILVMTQSRKCKILWFLHREKKNSKLRALLLHSKPLQNVGKILSLKTSAWIPNEIVVVLCRCFSYHHFHGGMIQNAPGRESTETLQKLAIMDSQMYLFQQPCSIKCASQKILLRA